MWLLVLWACGGGEPVLKEVPCPTVMELIAPHHPAEMPLSPSEPRGDSCLADAQGRVVRIDFLGRDAGMGTVTYDSAGRPLTIDLTRGEREEHYVLVYAPTGKLGAYAVDRDGDGASDLVLGFSYSPDGEWIEQAADFDGDGVNDTRQFMEGGRVVRIERREEGVMKVLRVTGWDETGRPTGFEEVAEPAASGP